MIFIAALFIAAILQLFGFGDYFVEAFKELFKLKITIASYYFMFFAAGLLIDIINFVMSKL